MTSVVIVVHGKNCQEVWDLIKGIKDFGVDVRHELADQDQPTVAVSDGQEWRKMNKEEAVAMFSL